MIDLALMQHCAPTVAPATLQQVIRVESAGKPYALNVNPKIVTVTRADGSKEKQQVPFKKTITIKSVQDAVTVAYIALQAGHSVDLGYMQVNSANLGSLGYSVEDMFDACKNLAAGARVLTAFYALALPKHHGNQQAALRAALSAYNTGDFNKGFLNGYLARYGATPLRPVPSLNPYTADSTVYVQPTVDKEALPMNIADKNTPIISRSSADSQTPGVQVEYTADEADNNGAFEELALSEKDAWESNRDIDPNDTTVYVQSAPKPKKAAPDHQQ